MPKTTIDTVAQYIAAQPKTAQATLKKVRAVIRKAAPDAVESLSYRIPTYKLGGKPLVYFAGWKAHYALYPIGPAVAQTLEKELEGYLVKKGTIQFPFEEAVPVKLIERIAKLRVKALSATGAKGGRREAST